MLAHTSPISGLAAYQDQYVATAGYDSRVILWDARTTQALASGNHDHLVNQCHFSKDGKYLVTSSADYSARVWSVPSMQLISVLNGHSDDVVGVAFHPESLQIATTSYDNDVCLFDHSGKLLHRLSGHTNAVHSVRWLDHKTLVTSGDDGTVRKWDAELGKLMETIDLGDIETDTIAVGEEERIYAGNDEGSVMLISQKQVIQQRSAHRAGIKNICYSKTHSKLLTLSYDQQAILWNINADGTFEQEHTFSLPQLVWARCCAFVGESKIIFGSFGSSYGIYDLRERRWHLEHISETKGKNAVLSFEQKIYAVDDAGQVLCNEKVINQVPSLLNFLVLCEDILVTGGHSGGVFNAKTGDLIYQHHSPLNCAAVFKKNTSTYVIIGAYTGEGILLKKNGEHFQHEANLLLHKNAVKGIACSLDSIYSVCATGAVAFHSTDTFKLQKFLKNGHDKIVDACIYIGRGRFASTGRDFSLRITSLDHQEVITTPHKNSPKCIAFAEEEFVATGAYRGEIHIYSLRHKTWQSFRPTTAGISSLCFDHSRKIFLACSYDERIYEIPIEPLYSDRSKTEEYLSCLQ